MLVWYHIASASEIWYTWKLFWINRQNMVIYNARHCKSSMIENHDSNPNELFCILLDKLRMHNVCNYSIHYILYFIIQYKINLYFYVNWSVGFIASNHWTAVFIILCTVGVSPRTPQKTVANHRLKMWLLPIDYNNV